jgi:hypothetical protein
VSDSPRPQPSDYGSVGFARGESVEACLVGPYRECPKSSVDEVSIEAVADKAARRRKLPSYGQGVPPESGDGPGALQRQFRGHGTVGTVRFQRLAGDPRQCRHIHLQTKSEVHKSTHVALMAAPPESGRWGTCNLDHDDKTPRAWCKSVTKCADIMNAPWVGPLLDPSPQPTASLQRLQIPASGPPTLERRNLPMAPHFCNALWFPDKGPAESKGRFDTPTP